MFSVQTEQLILSFFFSQFWQHLSLPLGLASPSTLSLSKPVVSSPAFCGAEHPAVPQSGTCGRLSPECASFCVQARAAGRCPASSSLLVPDGSLPSYKLWFAWFSPPLSFWSFSQLLRVFMVSPIPYFLIFSPSIPCTEGLPCFSILIHL